MYPFFFSRRGRHTRWTGDWSSDVCSSDLVAALAKSTTTQGPPYFASAATPLAMRSAPTSCGFSYCTGMQIGRASCRERVEISVVDVILKKKASDFQRIAHNQQSDSKTDLE